VVLTLILSGVVFYFFVFFPFFQIKEIRIHGDQKVPTDDLRKEVDFSIPRNFWKISSRSIFLVNSRRIKTEILEEFPQISKLILKRDFPNTLILEIEERKSVATYCDNQTCFLIDKTGVIFENIVESSSLKIIDNRPESEFSLGEQVLGEKVLSSIIEIEKKLKERVDINIGEFVVISEERLSAKTDERWDIYFDLKGDLSWQIEKLIVVLENEIPSEKRGNLEYIDLRFTRVYYKYR
jgi:cell division protein FtsQ